MLLTMLLLQVQHFLVLGKQLAAARRLPIAVVAIAPAFRETAGVSESSYNGIGLVLLPQVELLPPSSIDLAKSLMEAEPDKHPHQHQHFWSYYAVLRGPRMALRSLSLHHKKMAVRYLLDQARWFSSLRPCLLCAVELVCEVLPVACTSTKNNAHVCTRCQQLAAGVL
jgi:hypothetical protein